MKIAQIDRAFFELIRVQLVEEQYTPDRTLYSDAESYLVAKTI